MQKNRDGGTKMYVEYIDKMAKIVGWKATLVFNSICRTKIDESCDISLKLMAKQQGVSKPSIIRGVALLEKHNVINVERGRREDGSFPPNKYTINSVDKWVYEF